MISEKSNIWYIISGYISGEDVGFEKRTVWTKSINGDKIQVEATGIVDVVAAVLEDVNL